LHSLTARSGCLTRRAYLLKLSVWSELSGRKMSSGNEKKSLGDRMKEYEEITSHKVEPNQPFVIRLDGHHFSSYSKPFNKPFDERLANAMIHTARELLANYNPSTVYTCSDEITLCFPAIENATTQLPFNGKIQKLASLTASFAAITFYQSIMKQPYDADVDKNLLAHLNRTSPHFDSRVFNVPSDEELLNNMIWRCHYDCRRNSVFGLAQAHFSAKKLQGLNGKEMIALLKDEKQINWEDMPDHFKFGTFLKKEKFTIDAVDAKTGENVAAERSRIVSKSFDIGYSDDNVKFVVCKYVVQIEV